MDKAEPNGSRWRVGSKVPINVYKGDMPVCQCQTATYARQIVDAVNRMNMHIKQAPLLISALKAIEGAWMRSMVTGPNKQAPMPLPAQMIERMADEIIVLRERLAKELTEWEDRNGD